MAHEHDGYWWIYNSYQEWGDQIGASYEEIRGAVRRLLAKKFIDTYQSKGPDRSLHYRITDEFELFMDGWLVEHPENDDD